jgi:hypothetical protein
LLQVMIPDHRTKPLLSQDVPAEIRHCSVESRPTTWLSSHPPRTTVFAPDSEPFDYFDSKAPHQGKASRWRWVTDLRSRTAERQHVVIIAITSNHSDASLGCATLSTAEFPSARCWVSNVPMGFPRLHGRFATDSPSSCEPGLFAGGLVTLSGSVLTQSNDLK